MKKKKNLILQLSGISLHPRLDAERLLSTGLKRNLVFMLNHPIPFALFFVLGIFSAKAGDV